MRKIGLIRLMSSSLSLIPILSTYYLCKHVTVLFYESIWITVISRGFFFFFLSNWWHLNFEWVNLQISYLSLHLLLNISPHGIVMCIESVMFWSVYCVGTNRYWVYGGNVHSYTLCLNMRYFNSCFSPFLLSIFRLFYFRQILEVNKKLLVHLSILRL